MSSAAPNTNSLTLQGLPFVSVPSVGTGDLSFLSIPSNYTAVMNNELWLVNEDPNTGVLTRVCQISLPPGYKITQDQAPAPYDPQGTDKIPQHLLGVVDGLKNMHVMGWPTLKRCSAAFVQNWLSRHTKLYEDQLFYEQQEHAQYLRNKALEQQHRDNVALEERMRNITNFSRQSQEGLAQVMGIPLPPPPLAPPPVAAHFAEPPAAVPAIMPAAD